MMHYMYQLIHHKDMMLEYIVHHHNPTDLNQHNLEVHNQLHQNRLNNLPSHHIPMYQKHIQFHHLNNQIGQLYTQEQHNHLHLQRLSNLPNHHKYTNQY